MRAPLLPKTDTRDHRAQQQGGRQSRHGENGGQQQRAHDKKAP